MKKILPIAATILATSTAVQAQELNYGQLYAGNVNLSASGGDLDLLMLGGGLEFSLDSFLISADVAHLSADGIDVEMASIAGEYAFGSGLSLGLDYSAIDFMGFDFAMTSAYGVYQTGPFAMGLTLGESSDLNDTAVGVFASWDTSDFGTIGAEYYSMDDLDMYGITADYDWDLYQLNLAYLNMDVGGGASFDSFLVRGVYNMGGRFSLVGGYSTLSGAGLGVDAFSIGGEYEVADNVKLGASYGQVSIDGASENLDVITLGIEFETGKRKSARSTPNDLFGGVSDSSLGVFGY